MRAARLVAEGGTAMESESDDEWAGWEEEGEADWKWKRAEPTNFETFEAAEWKEGGRESVIVVRVEGSGEGCSRCEVELTH